MTPDTSLSFSPKTPKKSPSGRPWAALFVVLLLACGALWFWTARDPARREAALSTARETLSTVTKKTEQLITNVTDTVNSKLAGEQAQPPQDPKADEKSDKNTAAEKGHSLGQAENLTGDQTGGTRGAADSASANADSDSKNTLTETRASDPQTGATIHLGQRPAVPDNRDSPSDSRDGGDAEREGRTTRGFVTSDPGQTPPDAGGRSDDAIVRVSFIDDLARWMVEQYTPPSSRTGRGTLAIGIQSANARYGVGMKGLAWIGDDLPTGRAEALNYVYSSNMLTALYRMYVDRFMQAIAEATTEPRKNGKTLEPVQIAEMYRLYAGRLRALSGAMQSVASISNLRGRMARLHAGTQAMVTANSHYMEEVFKFDQAREKKSEPAIEAARKAMEQASDAYRQATVDRENLRADLIATIRTNPEARSFGDDNLLYVANWIDRRLQQSPFALESSQQAANLLRELAKRFDQATGILP